MQIVGFDGGGELKTRLRGLEHWLGEERLEGRGQSGTGIDEVNSFMKD